MEWKPTFTEIQHRMEDPFTDVWNTAPEIQDMMRWNRSKTYRTLDQMVKNYWLIWRWHPKRNGWYATKQYALPWLAKGK